MRKSIAAAVIAASAATSACGQKRVKTAGRPSRGITRSAISTRSRSPAHTTSSAHRRQSGGPRAGSEKMLEHTVVEVQGDKLVIRPRTQKGWFHSGWHFRDTAEFTVTVPKLRGAAIGGSGDIKVDEVQGEAFEGSVAGSGGLDVAKLDVQSLKLSVAGSGGAQGRRGRAQSAEIRHRRLGRHRRQGRPGADRRSVDRRVGQRRRQRDRNRRRQHHGFRRRRRYRRRQMLGQQGRLRQRQLLLKRS